MQPLVCEKESAARTGLGSHAWQVAAGGAGAARAAGNAIGQLALALVGQDVETPHVLLQLGGPSL